MRGVGSLPFGSSDTFVESGSITGVLLDSDVVVVVTGQAAESSTSDAVNTGMITSDWNASSDRAVLKRGASGNAAMVSFAVVEFTGVNWSIHRSTHVYDSAGVVETESIPPVTSLDHAFLHVQQRTSGTGVDDQGAEVWLSDTSTVSFLIEPTVTTPGGVTSVAWVVANSGDAPSPLHVRHYSGLRSPGGAEEDVWAEIISPVLATDRSSIFGETGRSSGTGAQFPRGAIQLALTSSDEVTLTQSDSGATQAYRFSVAPIFGLEEKELKNENK